MDARDSKNASLEISFHKLKIAPPDQQEAVSGAAFALSEASVAIAEAAIAATPEVVLPSAASAAMSQAASFLSSVSQNAAPTTVSATLTGTAPVTLSSGGTASVVFPALTSNSSVVLPTLKSPTPTPTSTSVSIIVTDGSDATTSTIVFTGGASYEGHSLVGLLLLILIGVIGSVAFMI